MTTAYTHPDVPPIWVKSLLASDDVLMNISVSVNGEPRTLQGVYYMAVPQEDENPFPHVLLASPIFVTAAQRMHPNGPYIRQATFWQDVWVQARDVAIDDPALSYMHARAIGLLEGQSGPVDGGAVTGCFVERFLPEFLFDEGGLIYSKIGTRFEMTVQLNG